MVRVTLDLSEDLIKELELIERTYGMEREEIMLSALKRYLDKQLQLFSEAIKRSQ